MITVTLSETHKSHPAYNLLFMIYPPLEKRVHKNVNLDEEWSPELTSSILRLPSSVVYPLYPTLGISSFKDLSTRTYLKAIARAILPPYSGSGKLYLQSNRHPSDKFGGIIASPLSRITIAFTNAPGLQRECEVLSKWPESISPKLEPPSSISTIAAEVFAKTQPDTERYTLNKELVDLLLRNGKLLQQTFFPFLNPSISSKFWLSAVAPSGLVYKVGRTKHYRPITIDNAVTVCDEILYQIRSLFTAHKTTIPPNIAQTIEALRKGKVARSYVEL